MPELSSPIAAKFEFTLFDSWQNDALPQKESIEIQRVIVVKEKKMEKK